MLKKIVYGEIKNHRGEYISSYDNDIRTMVNAWKYQVEKMLRDVNKEYAKILVLKKQ
jgi:hypothetical protein